VIGGLSMWTLKWIGCVQWMNRGAGQDAGSWIPAGTAPRPKGTARPIKRRGQEWGREGFQKKIKEGRQSQEGRLRVAATPGRQQRCGESLLEGKGKKTLKFSSKE